MPDRDPIDRRLIVVGDRVLIEPDAGEDRTEVGLYLPRWAVEKESVQVGRVVACGPGIPVAEPNSLEDEPWKTSNSPPRYVPMQARIGDYAIFLRKAAVEVKFEGRSYLIVPQAAILLLHRNPRPRSAVEDLLEAETFESEEQQDDAEPDDESAA
ncbi:MAG: co-chaperone GroES [Gemmatimonadota bacterium]